MPDAVTRASTGVKTAFLRALADADGVVEETSVHIPSGSYDLLLGAKMLLSEIGVTAQIRTAGRAQERHHDRHALVITAADALDAFRQQVGFSIGRKQDALDAICDSVSGDRPALDVLPECDHHLAAARQSLRLHRSELECWPADTGDHSSKITTGTKAETELKNDSNSENDGDSDSDREQTPIPLSTAKQLLDCFQARQDQARKDQQRVQSASSWATLDRLTNQYHVSQRELAAKTGDIPQQVSRGWGTDESLRRKLSDRLATILGRVAETDLSRLRELTRGDVRWRRVAAVEQVESGTDPTATDTPLRPLRRQLAALLGVAESKAAQRTREVLASPPTVDSWAAVADELQRHNLSRQRLADRLSVAQPTISGWLTNGGDDVSSPFAAVQKSASALIDTRRAALRDRLAELSARREPKVFDLTVEGTHNFLANSVVVHNSEDQSAMHEALEQQSISVSKAGINATLKSRCSLLGAANPTYGRFDQYEPIAEQIDLEPPLISRFDLIFTVTDKPDEQEDAALAEHILTTNYAGELNTHRTETTTSNFSAEEIEQVTDTVEPTISPDLLRKYVAYAKRTCFPTMTQAARDEIQSFYVDLRAQGTSEDAPVPVTARKLEALVRLAEASARVRLSDTIAREDAHRAIEIAEYSLKEIGLDPETGEFDADVIETGTSKSQRDRIKNIKRLIADIEDEYDEGAPVDVVLDRATENGVDTEKARHEINQLKQKGEVYEPRTDHLRTT